MIDTSTARVYRSGLGGRIGALIGAVIAVPLIAIGFPSLVLSGMLDIKNSKILIAVCVAILVVGGVWALVHIFITGPVRFSTDARTVRLRRGLRITNEWQRDSTDFASFVERQSTNGIPSGSTRKLIATTATERTTVHCRWFSAATFNDLMADLAPVGPASFDDGGAVAGAVGERPRDFVLDPRAGRLRGARLVVVAIAVIVLVAVIGVIGGYLVTDPTGDPEALVFIGGVVVLLVVIGLVAFVSRRRRFGRIPTSIGVTTSTLRVGERVLYFGQLESIVLTPPSYSGNSRTLTLVEKIGTRTSYPLGSGASVGAPIFAEYAEFVAMLGRVAPAGVVRFDLR